MMHSENLCYQRSKASASVSVPLIAGLHYGLTGMPSVTGVAAYLGGRELGCLAYTFRCVVLCGFSFGGAKKL